MTSRVTVCPVHRVLDRNVDVPGSKSISNRALICAALASGESVIRNIAPGDDTTAMIAALSVLGGAITRSGDEVRVSSPIDLASTQELTLNANLAGTTARFVTAVAALRSGSTIVTGEAALLRRPMRGLFETLKSFGAGVEYLGEPWHLPARVSAGAKLTSEVSLNGGVSSQFVTALMLIAPCVEDGLSIRLTGRVISQPYIQMTVDVMRSFGARVALDGDLITVRGGGYTGQNFIVEPDASSASYPLAAAAIVGGRVQVRGVTDSSSQGDAQFAAILGLMGCEVDYQSSGVTVARNRSTELQGVEIDMSGMSDLVPTLAVVAMFANTPTRIGGVGFIREKESDRLGDLALELRKVGGVVEVTDDGLIVSPSATHSGVVDTHHDHRLAMALALVGLVCDGVQINDPEVVSKSWPSYFEMISEL
jgi:3-phosphoshikimate 1-carboxyvinyltransferase